MARKTTRANLLRVGGLLLGMIVAGANGAIASVNEQELRFRVLLNDDEIGFHSFRVASDNGRETVDIAADFDVTFLAIPIYSYMHRNREIWRDGCLEEITSVTDDNGDEYRVDGRRKPGAFEVSTPRDNYFLQNECVMTFAYWNRDFLRQGKLLNAQTGEYLEVEIEADGTEELKLGEREISAERFNLRNREQEIDISLWYQAQSGKWLALESRVDGRVIRYLPAEFGPVSRASAPRRTEK